MPILGRRAGVEEGAKVGLVQVDKGFVGGDGERVRDRERHVRVAAREDYDVAWAKQRHGGEHAIRVAISDHHGSSGVITWSEERNARGALESRHFRG